MSDPAPPADEARPTIVRRLSDAGAQALPAVASAVVAIALVTMVVRPWPGFLAAVFMVGTLGLFGGIAFAIFSPAAAVWPTRLAARGRRPPVRTVLPWLLAAGVVAAGLGAVLPPVADAVVPARIGMRATLVEVAALGLGVAIAGATLLGLWRIRRPDDRLPLWTVAVLYLGFRVVTAARVDAVFVGHARAVELLALGLVSVSLWGAYDREHPIGRQANRVAVVIVAVSVVATFGLLGRRSLSRASFQVAYPGAGELSAYARTLLDYDGDGFAAVLGGTDCDDWEPAVHPAALEVVGNGVDDNCAGGDLAEFTLPSNRARRRGERARSLVLVTIDALRPDAIGAPDDPDAPMPGLSRFAARSAWFPRAYAPAPYTDHSLRSVMTGHYPMDYEVGQRFFGQAPSLAELLRAIGHRTVAIQQVWLLNPYVTQGFDEIDDELAVQNREFAGKTAQQTTDKALARYEALRAAEKPFVLWVHYFDPHHDYLPREGTPISGDRPLDHYRQELWATDQQVTRLLHGLEQTGFTRDGVVVVAGDHGELVGEGGRFGHAFWMHDLVLRTQLLVHAAEAVPGRYDVRVRLLDLYPTLLEMLAGMTIPSDGEHLAEVWSGRATEDRDVFARSLYLGMNKRAAVIGRFKLVQDMMAGAEYLYDLEADPYELRNRIEDDPETAARLRDAIGKRWDASMNDMILTRKLEALPQRMLPADVVGPQQRHVFELQCERGSPAACAMLDRLESGP